MCKKKKKVETVLIKNIQRNLKKCKNRIRKKYKHQILTFCLTGFCFTCQGGDWRILRAHMNWCLACYFKKMIFYAANRLS